MDFKDILNKNTNKDELVLGFNSSGFHTINIKDTNSIIITGETGTGKSILLDQIIIELMNKYTSLELSLIPIDTSGVELLMYENTPYTDLSAINDLDKSEVILSKILGEIERRKQLLKDNNILTVDEYNKYNEDTLPQLVIAIDDDKMLLRGDDVGNMLKGIISQIDNLNIMFILVTNDIFSKFFTKDDNMLAKLQISFDLTSEEESINNNVAGANNLGIGYYLARYNNKDVIKYHNFEFDDTFIDNFINR